MSPATALAAWQAKSRGLARTIYIRCTYGIFGLEITKYTVYIYVCIYGSGQPFKSTKPCFVTTFVGLARTVYMRRI